MALRALLLKLGVDVDKDAESKADATIGKLKKAATVAGVAFAAILGVKKLGGLANEVAAVGDELDKTSKQLGINAEALQEWRFAAGLGGASATEMSGALQKIQKNAFEAANGNKLLSENFETLGVKVKNADGTLKNADQLLTEMSDGFAGLENQTEKVGLAMSIMGRSGTKLLPLFDEGAEGIAKMRQEARDLGGVMSNEMIAQSAELTDSQHRLNTAMQGIRLVIAEKVLPVAIRFYDWAGDMVVRLRGPVKAAIGVVETAFRFFGFLIDQVSQTFGGFGESVLTLEDIFKVVASAMVAFATLATVIALKIAAAWVIANLPLLAMIAIFVAISAAIGLIIQDFLVWQEGGDSLIGRLIEGFRNWLNQLGDIVLTVGVFFEKMFMKVFGVSEETARAIVGAFLAIPTGIGELAAKIYLFFVDIKNGVTAIFQGVIDFFTSALDKVTNKIRETKNTIADTIGLGDVFGTGASNVAANAARIDARIAAARARSQAAQAARAVSSQVSNSAISSDNSSNIINIDARGQTNGAQIGRDAAKAFSEQKRNRQAGNSFVVAQ